MAYNEFAYFYDSFNEDADYEALYRRIADLQLLLDLANQTETFSVELEGWTD